MPSNPDPTGTITPDTLTIEQIEVSPLNIRRHRATIEALAVLEASILARGLIQPINVHPLKGGKKFGAFAGGRRTRAIRNLVQRGDLPADWPVRVEIYREHSDIAIIELSLGENVNRAELERYEICAAIRALGQRGETLEAIAHAIGQPVDVVRRWQRVGLLAEPIFTAFAEARLTVKEAQAYAATEDHALQLATFNELNSLLDHARTPDMIRAALKIGDRNEARLLRLVGDEAYRAAGGRFELDLFAEDNERRGRIVDEPLLHQLAEARLEEVRAVTRTEASRDIRFGQARPKNPAGYDDYNLQITPKREANGVLMLPEGDIFALIQLTESGDPEVTYWWESRKAKFGTGSSAAVAVAQDRGVVPKAADALREPGFYAAPARAAVKDEHGISADALEVMKGVRREVLRAMLVEDARGSGAAGRDFALWAQLRALLGAESSRTIGAGAPSRGDSLVGLGHAAIEAARAQVDQHRAHDVWEAAVREVTTARFITEPDLAAAFFDWLGADEAMHRLAGAVLAGMTLLPSANAPGFSPVAHDALAAEIGGDNPALLRALWSPTADFLALLPRKQRTGPGGRAWGDGSVNGIQHDMSRKLQHQLAAVLEREAAIASVVLNAGEVATLMIEAAVMMVRTAAATIANGVSEAEKVETIFDATVEAIVAGARGSREDSLARVRVAREAWAK